MLKKGDIKLLKDIIGLQMQDLEKEKNDISFHISEIESNINKLLIELSEYNKKLCDCQEKIKKVSGYMSVTENEHENKNAKVHEENADKNNINENTIKFSVMNDLYFEDILKFLNIIYDNSVIVK